MVDTGKQEPERYPYREEIYPYTVTLGTLTATRPLGARIIFNNTDGRRWQGMLLDLTPSPVSTVFYRMHLTPEGEDADAGPVAFDLPLTHEVTLLGKPDREPDLPGFGHTFRFTVEVRGSSGILNEHESTPHTDEPFFMGEPWTLEVRAWSLVAALRKAADAGMLSWRRPNGKRLDEE